MTGARPTARVRRQADLVARSAVLRDELRAELRAWTPVAQRLDVGLGALRTAWHWLRSHPEAPIVAALVIVVARPHRAWRWSLRLWSAWRLWHRLRAPR